MEKESAIQILKVIMKRHLRSLESSPLDLSKENFVDRFWWDRGNRDFWVASAAGSQRNFASQVDKLTKGEFAELAKLIVEEEQALKGR